MGIRLSACSKGFPACFTGLVIESSSGIAGAQNHQRIVLKRRMAQGKNVFGNVWVVRAIFWEPAPTQASQLLPHEANSSLLILFCDILLGVVDIIGGGFFDPLYFDIR